MAAEGKSQESNQSVSERIATWLKTCLKDWDAATHMTRKEWRVTCERVSQERGKFLRESPGRENRGLVPTPASTGGELPLP